MRPDRIRYRQTKLLVEYAMDGSTMPWLQLIRIVAKAYHMAERIGQFTKPREILGARRDAGPEQRGNDRNKGGGNDQPTRKT